MARTIRSARDSWDYAYEVEVEVTFLGREDGRPPQSQRFPSRYRTSEVYFAATEPYHCFADFWLHDGASLASGETGHATMQGALKADGVPTLHAGDTFYGLEHGRRILTGTIVAVVSLHPEHAPSEP